MYCLDDQKWEESLSLSPNFLKSHLISAGRNISSGSNTGFTAHKNKLESEINSKPFKSKKPQYIKWYKEQQIVRYGINTIL